MKQRRLPLKMVGFTISHLHWAYHRHHIAEMMASVAYKPQKTEGEKSTDS